MNASSASHPPTTLSEHLFSTHLVDDNFSPLPSSSSHSSLDSTPSDFEFQNLIERYPFAAEESYFTRPNRYHGPVSTWRSWTADDRAVTDALDQDRAENLSVHLYNVFALKKKAQTPTAYKHGLLASVRSISNDEDVNAITTDDDETTFQQTFLPPRQWTAWPLRGWEVPRPSRNGQSVHSHRIMKDARPSENLEEALIAIALKLAKEKWNIRESNQIPQTLSRKKRNWKIERQITMQQLIDSGAVQPRNSVEREPDNRDAMEASAPEDLDDNNSPESEIEAPHGMPTFTSQAFHVESSSESELEDLQSKPENSDYEPVFSADDDKARRILMPSTRHVLSKLDDLLLALHRARKAYASRDPNKDVSTSLSESASMSRSRARSAEARSDTDVERNEDQFLRTGTFRSRTKRRRQERDRGRKRQRSPPAEPSLPSLGLRDWSDVIGMTTLAGWKTETVARAAERCAKLFNENMMFRTFHDPASPSAPKAKQNLHTTYEEEHAFAPPEKEDTDNDDDPMPLELKPKLHYIRTSSPCTRCQTLNIRCEPPTPSPHTEGQFPTDPTTHVSCTACATIQDLSTCSRISIKPTAPPVPSASATSRTCPHPTCRRHTQPFKKRYHLERHIRDVHHGTTTEPAAKKHTQSPAPMIVRTKPTAHETGKDAKSGAKTGTGTGLDLACPVLTCQRHLHNYSRPARLYAHIKREHPEVNLPRFKGLVGQRGESRRGKYDRSKTRSQSGSRSQSAAAAAAHTLREEEEPVDGRWLGDEEGEDAEFEEENDDEDDDDHEEQHERVDMANYSGDDGSEEHEENEETDEDRAGAAGPRRQIRVESDHHAEHSDESM